MKQILESINLTEFNCDFVDVRVEETKASTVMFKNGELEQGIEVPKMGAFIRVLKEGKWYYASTSDIDSIEKTIEELIISSGETVTKKEAVAVSYDYKELKNIKEIHLVNNSLEEKKAILLPLVETAEKEELIISAYITYRDDFAKKLYKNSKGSFYYYDVERSGISAYYTMKEEENIYSTSYSKFAHEMKEFENIKEEFAADIEEAKLFINAPTIEPGKYPVVLSPEVAGIFAHESFGHKSESDFMIGDENMKKEWELGKKVGSDKLSIIDEGDIPGTSGYTPYDDEGVKKTKTYLIKDGVLTGRLHSEMTAGYLGEEPTGNARAMSFNYEPIVRMTNTYIGAGDLTFDELIAPIENGFYLKKSTHGSGMSTFTIAIGRAWRIKDGKIAEPVKVNVVSGTIFETLFNIDALTKDVEILSFVGGGCGKMEQFPLPVGFGGPYVRVKEITVS